MTEDQKEVLTLLGQLPPEKLEVMCNFIRLLVYSPGFRAAHDALIPPGAENPPWEDVDKLVAEWMKKEARSA